MNKYIFAMKMSTNFIKYSTRLWLIPLILVMSKLLMTEGATHCCRCEWNGDILDDKQAYPCQKNSKLDGDYTMKEECKNGEESCYYNLQELGKTEHQDAMAIVSSGCLTDKTRNCLKGIAQVTLDDGGKCSKIAKPTLQQHLSMHKCIYQPDEDLPSLPGDIDVNQKLDQTDTICGCKGNECNGQSGVINLAA